MRGEPIRGHAREGRPGTRPSPDICVGHAEGRRRTPPPLYLRSRNESPPLSWRRASEFFGVCQRVAERLCDEVPPHPPEERMVV